MISLEAEIGDQDHIGPLHIDIQGGKANLIESRLGLRNEKVAYALIATSSKSIEGRLYATLTPAGRLIEIERPAFYEVRTGYLR
ncbi:hypothetical protein [Burkholderia sp. RF4-BP95]|uniref:hypothetical protein n=1 Tax=Burkholderia sp. RF4-BP95 TaxID=1637845 RepID=UPI000AC1EAA0|nr:hypothetical protein [Burkholderia sp. RF4-BP95]